MFHVKQFMALKKYCEEQGLIFDTTVEERFSRFAEMLLEKNKVMNLTAVTDPSGIEYKHYIDSLAAASFLQEQIKKETDPGYSVIDIGTGAGFPGLPLSFVLPEASFTLSDALEKRIGFIKEVVYALHLTNVSAIHGRAEELGRGQYRERFNAGVSRAVADSSVLLEYGLPLIKCGGFFILYKSGDYQEELQKASYALQVLGGEVAEIKEFRISDTPIKRSLILIKKTRSTPDQYPRRAGKPAKSPLLSK